jgi:hypothetical protein
MRRDYQIAILLAIAAIPAGIALMAAPDYIEVSKEHPGLFFWGGFILTICLVAAAIVIALRGEASGARPGHRRRMIALTLVIIGLLFIGGGVGVYFWPTRPTDAPYLARLAELGWTIKPSPEGIRFEVANQSLPPMKDSADLFQHLKQPFRLYLQNVIGLEGLHYLANIENCTEIGISAGEFTDISELRGFRYLGSLGISQVPLNGVGTVDPSPLSSLTNLQRLTLYGTRVRNVEFLVELTKITSLNIANTLVTDMSPISKLSSLESLDLRETRIVDLHPLGRNRNLSEITIGVEQIPSLLNLAQLDHLKKLTIFDQGYLDFSQVGVLVNLESVLIFGPSVLDLTAVRNLTKLRNLTINPLGFASGRFTPVTDVEAIGELTELRVLSLGDLQVRDIEFVRKLRNLNQIEIARMPITSIESLRGLKELAKIHLSGIPVIDIAVLLDLPALTELTISRMPAREDVLTALEQRGVKVKRL